MLHELIRCPKLVIYAEDADTGMPLCLATGKQVPVTNEVPQRLEECPHKDITYSDCSTNEAHIGRKEQVIYDDTGSRITTFTCFKFET